MTSLAGILKDPPPAYAFELSEAGIAFARVAEPAEVNFTPLEAGVLLVSPAHDNLHQPQIVQERIQALAPPNGYRKRRAALILPTIARAWRSSISTISPPINRSKSPCCVSA